MICVFLIAILYFSLHKKRPEGKSGTEADRFAMQIQEAVKHEKYVNTDYIQWTFRNKNDYLWSKKSAKVEVKWENYTANLDLKDSKNSTIMENGVLIDDSTKSKLLDKALSNFNNDSFWVVAPHKFFDEGVSRELVDLENGSKGLLITYASDGTTPGDSYLWKVDENYIPTSYQMWVSIIPIGGLEATWENWTTTASGAYLSQQHSLLGFGIPISNLKAWNE